MCPFFVSISAVVRRLPDWWFSGWRGLIRHLFICLCWNTDFTNCIFLSLQNRKKWYCVTKKVVRLIAHCRGKLQIIYSVWTIFFCASLHKFKWMELCYPDLDFLSWYLIPISVWTHRELSQSSGILKEGKSLIVSFLSEFCMFVFLSNETTIFLNWVWRCHSEIVDMQIHIELFTYPHISGLVRSALNCYDFCSHLDHAIFIMLDKKFVTPNPKRSDCFFVRAPADHVWSSPPEYPHAHAQIKGDETFCFDWVIRPYASVRTRGSHYSKISLALSFFSDH